MPRFQYKAYDGIGVLRHGEVVSATREGALAIIHQRGEQPIDVREGCAATHRSSPTGTWPRSRRLPGQSLAVLTRELATLVNAEIPLDEALRIVAMQPLIGAKSRTVAGEVLSAVTEGRSLSAALAATGAVPEFHWRLVETGESSGQLGPVLADLATFLERSAEARAKLGSALLYPAILMAAACATLAIVAGILVPAILPIYDEARTPPPAIVAWLSGLGGWLATWWPWLAILVLGTGFGLAAAGRSPPLALWRDRMILRLPIAGSLVTRRDTARLARTLATMTRNGVPLMAAVETASGVLGNHALAWAVLVARDGLKEGGTLVGPLRETGLFPEMALRLIAAGEHTGQLDVMLSRTAEIYEASLARDVDRMTGLLTPILTVVIGLMVGGLVVSVMGALSGINELALR